MQALNQFRLFPVFIGIWTACCLTSLTIAQQESHPPVDPVKRTDSESDNQLRSQINSAMTFHASFDSVTDANLFGNGDGLLKTAESVSRKTVETNGPVAGVAIAKGGGVTGDCLKFDRKPNKTLFYESELAADLKPVPDWSGSISFWLQLDPNKDLGNGYCDPLQVAGRKWNDGAIWVDFDDVTPRTFRLGVFSDLDKWNPKGIKWDDVPKQDLPLITVHSPSFSSDSWTHVAITFTDINSTKNGKATAKLYLNGKLEGTLNRKIDISWNAKTDPPAAIMLGINYVGGIDELAVFDRELSADEVEFLNRSIRN